MQKGAGVKGEVSVSQENATRKHLPQKRLQVTKQMGRLTPESGDFCPGRLGSDNPRIQMEGLRAVEAVGGSHA